MDGGAVVETTKGINLPAGYEWASYRGARSLHVAKPDGWLLCGKLAVVITSAHAAMYGSAACQRCLAFVPSLEPQPAVPWLVETMRTWQRRGEAEVMATSRFAAERLGRALKDEDIQWSEEKLLDSRWTDRIHVSRRTEDGT